MTDVNLRPTLLNSSASAASAEEARYRIDAPPFATRASRIVAVDQGAAAVVRRIADLPWTGDAHFLLFEASHAVDGLDGLAFDASLRTVDGAAAMLSDELTGADVIVMVATADDGAQAATVIGEACFARGVTTAGLVVAEGRVADKAVAALRPHAMVLLVTGDADDLQEMLSALRA